VAARHARCAAIAVSANRRDELPAVLKKRLQGQVIVDLRRGVAPFSTFGRARESYWELLPEASPWITQELPEPLLARLFRVLRHVDRARQVVRLVGIGRTLEPEGNAEGLQAQLV
jgi:hypothetical protein